MVATVLTACGIETAQIKKGEKNETSKVATVLTACGIETNAKAGVVAEFLKVATVLTACGIETAIALAKATQGPAALQQYLPLAVLKHHKG